jgi:D-amino peptidase
MKVYISVDIEGVAGIVDWQQTNTSGGAEFELGKRLMTEETNAAIEGALQAGATEFVVNDSHEFMRNIHPELLHPAARLIQGSEKPMSMVEGLDASCAAVFLVGYHATAGVRDGTLNHVYHPREVRYNGVRYGEAGVNASIAGYYGVPVVLVTGDDAAIRDAEETLPPHVGVSVKRGITRYAADSLHPATARERIREGARQAIERLGEFQPLTFSGPITVEQELEHSHQADRVALMPTIERTGDRTLRFVAPDALTAFRTFLVTGMVQGD